MTSLTILTILTALGVLWALRAYHLDAARQRRRADRLAARCAELRDQVDDLLDELDAHVDNLTPIVHPSLRPVRANNVVVLPRRSPA